MTKTATAKILNLLRTMPVPIQTAITTEEYLREAGVVSMGSNFRTQFLGLEIGELAELAVHELIEASLDAPILAELGDKAEISISQFRVFLSANRKSREWFVFASSVDYPNGWYADYQVVSRN